MKTFLTLSLLLISALGFTQNTSILPQKLVKYLDSIPSTGIKINQLHSAYEQLKNSTDSTDLLAKKKIDRWMMYEKPKYNIRTDGTLDLKQYNTALKAIYSSSQFCDINDPDGADWQPDGPPLSDSSVLHLSPSQSSVSGTGWRGRIDAFHVSKLNPDIIVIGTYASGIFRTVDGGQTWVCVTDQTNFPIIGVKKMISHPLNNNHLLAITGAGGVEGALIQSFDLGITWQIVDNSLPEFNDIGFHPANQNLFIAISETEVWHSNYNLTSWNTFSSLNNLNVHDYLHRLKILNNRLFVVVRNRYNSKNSVFESTFSHDANGLVSQNWNPNEKIATWIGSSANAFYFIFSNTQGDTMVGLTQIDSTRIMVKFSNDGSSTSLINSTTHPALADACINSNPTGMGINLGQIILTHSDKKVWITGIGFIGIDLNAPYTGPSDFITINSLSSTNYHDDYRESQIRISASGDDELYFSNDGGLAKLTENSGSFSLTSLNGNLSNNLVHAFHVHEKTGKIAYAFQDHAMRTRLGNGSFEQSSYIWEGSAAMIQRDYPTSIVGENAYTYVQDKHGSPHPIVASSLSNGGFYLSGLFTQYRHYPERFIRGIESHDGFPSGGVVMNRAANITQKIQLPTPHSIGATAICERKPQFIFAALRDGIENQTKLFKSIDDGYNWIAMTNSTVLISGETAPVNLDTALNYKGIRCIAMDHFDSNYVYLGIGNTETIGDTLITNERFKVLRSIDGGQTFVDYSAGLPALPIDRLLSIESNNELLVCATSIGVFYRTNEMASWQCYSHNLPRALITGIQYDYCNNMLYVSTYGRGIYKTPLNIKVSTGLKEEINTNTVWNTSMEKDRDVVVKAGNELTINSSIVSFYPNKKIIVEPGARLTISGATLTSTCNAYWQGIEVHGDYQATQNSLNQGKVTVTNSTIENAREAIMPWKYNDWTQTGGIIQAVKSTFRNNDRSIQYMAYQNTNPTSGAELDNIGYFTDCTFEWTDDFFETKPRPAITMNAVKGVKISGCTFRDLRTTITDVTNRAKGIYTIDAGYSVKGTSLLLTPPQHDYFSTANYDVCEFINLYKGVENLSGTSAYPFLVDHSRFTNCQEGISVNGVDHAVLTRNYFNHDNNCPLDIQYAYNINLYASSAFNVQGNVFDNEIGIPNLGVHALNTGTAENEIRKNKFNNQLTANGAVGSNANDIAQQQLSFGLQFICNENTGNKNDIYVIALGGSNDQGVRLFQGSPGQATLNELSPTLQAGGYHFTTNDQQNLKYYWNGTTGEPTVINGNITPEEVLTLSDCPSHFDGTIVMLDENQLVSDDAKAGLEDELSSLKTEYNNLFGVFSSNLASGDASNLHNAVADLSVGNRNAVKASLLNNSPYLSLTLLTELGNISSAIFPHEWYQEVIEDNIEVFWDADFRNFLRDKSEPLPTTLFNLLQDHSQTTLTQRGLDMAEIGDLTSRIAEIENLLLADLSFSEDPEDQANIPLAIDARNNYVKRAELIDFYIGIGNLDEAYTQISLLRDELPHMLSATLNQELTDFISLKEYLLEQLNTGLTLNVELSVDNIDFLLNARDTYTGRARFQASNILCFYAEICEESDPMNLAAIGRSPGESTTEESLSVLENTSPFMLYPNPNEGTFVIKGMHQSELDRIEIVDIQGKIMPFELQNINETTVQIDFNQAKRGLYLVKMWNRSGETQVIRIMKN